MNCVSSRDRAQTRTLTIATFETTLPGKLVRHASQNLDAVFPVTEILTTQREQHAPRFFSSHFLSFPADPIPSLLLRKD